MPWCSHQNLVETVVGKPVSQCAFPSVVGDGLGADVDFDLAAGRDNAAVDRAEESRAVLGFDARLGIDPQLKRRKCPGRP